MGRLTTRQDAYGAAVWDHFRGFNAYEICERDDGYSNFSPGPVAYFAPFKDWPRHQRQAIRLARGRVLDIGCGAGRATLHLQEKGLDVVGIDVSPLAVRVCRARGLKKARVMSITDVGPRLGMFDTIVMYGNNFGLLGGVRQARRLLRRFHGITSPGARIIAESTDPMLRPAPRGFNPRILRCHRAYHRLNVGRGRLPGQLKLRVRYLSYVTPYFDYLLVSKDQMHQVIAGTGWRISRCFDSEGSSYVAVLEKERLS
jgi:SAM-dependent methyltransferase